MRRAKFGSRLLWERRQRKREERGESERERERKREREKEREKESKREIEKERDVRLVSAVASQSHGVQSQAITPWPERG